MNIIWGDGMKRKRQSHSYKRIMQVYALRAEGYVYWKITQITGVPRSTICDMVNGAKSYKKFKEMFLKEIK